jgi:hypothetical protein
MGKSNRNSADTETTKKGWRIQKLMKSSFSEVILIGMSSKSPILFAAFPDTKSLRERLNSQSLTNLMLELCGGKRSGKHWANRFINAQPSIKTKFNRP